MCLEKEEGDGLSMSRCRSCGEPIDEMQADKFQGLCPACVRQRKSGSRAAENQSCELGLWAIMMYGGVLIVLGSAVGPLWFYLLLPVSLPGFWTLLAPFIVVGAIAGIIISWFGRKMYRETKAKGVAQY